MVPGLRRGGGGTALAGHAGWAQAKQLESVGIHAVAGAPGNLADDVLEAPVTDLVRASATRTDDVVVVGALADDVGVFPRRQVEALHRAECLEDLERSEDGGSTDPETFRASLRDELRSREMPVPAGDQRGQRPSRLRQAVAGPIEGRDDRCCVHTPTVTQLRPRLNT